MIFNICDTLGGKKWNRQWRGISAGCCLTELFSYFAFALSFESPFTNQGTYCVFLFGNICNMKLKMLTWLKNVGTGFLLNKGSVMEEYFMNIALVYLCIGHSSWLIRKPALSQCVCMCLCVSFEVEIWTILLICILLRCLQIFYLCLYG